MTANNQSGAGIPRTFISISLKTPDPLNGLLLWARRRIFMVLKAKDGVREIGANGVGARETDRRLERVIKENPPPPLASAPSRARLHEHLLIAVPRAVYDYDRDFNGGERVFALMWTLCAIYRKTFKGAAPRVIVIPHDDGDGIVHARFGPHLYLPTADEPTDGALTAFWTDAAGGVRQIDVPIWPCCQLTDGRVDLCDKPFGVYAGQRRLILGMRKTGGDVRLVVPGDEADERVAVDLHRARLAWREGNAYETSHSVADGVLALRLTPAPNARPANVKPEVRPPEIRSAAAPAPASSRVGAVSPKTPKRAAPYLRPANVKAVLEEKPTLVPPPLVRGADGEKPTLALPISICPKQPEGVLAVTAFALPRVDGDCANAAASGWTIHLGPNGLPVRKGCGAPVAVALRANERAPHILYKRPANDGAANDGAADDGAADDGAADDGWLPLVGAAAQNVLPPGCRLSPAPKPLDDRYHALLSIPIGQPIILKEGRRRFGRAASADDDKLSFNLLAAGMLKLQKGGVAGFDAFNLSHEHGALSLEQGQLHVTLTTGRTPIWKLAADGAVGGRIDPQDQGELILTAEESFLVGAYVVAFLGEE